MSGAWRYAPEEGQDERAHVGNVVILQQNGTSVKVQLGYAGRVLSVINCGGSACTIEQDWRKNVSCVSKWEVQAFLLDCTWDAVDRATDAYTFELVDGDTMKVMFGQSDAVRDVAYTFRRQQNATTGAAPAPAAGAVTGTGGTTNSADSVTAGQGDAVEAAAEKGKEAVESGVRRLRDILRDRD